MRKNNTIIAIFIAVSLILQGTIALADHNQMEEGETGNNISEIKQCRVILKSNLQQVTAAL